MEFRKCTIAGIKYGLGHTDAERGAAKRAGKHIEEDPVVESDDVYASSSLLFINIWS